jgi:UDP-N-acetylglucosamine 2-epimerase (non-hydrolysing)
VIRIIHVVAARPNYMKIAPVWKGLRGYKVDQTVVHTGQHYDANLSAVFFGELALPVPDVQLAVGSGGHGAQTAKALAGLEEAFEHLKPDLVVVPGDVNSTLAAALAAAKLNIPVCHVESGLRSHDRSMPEEINRRLTDHVATLLLTTSEDAGANLAAEGIIDGVRLVGNTMIDSLQAALPAAAQLGHWSKYGLKRGNYVLVTLHRPALVDNPVLLRQTMEALGSLSETLPVIFPVHPRTRERIETFGIPVVGGMILTPPLAYTPFLSLELGAAAVLTDSGGVQEETTALSVRCFTLRANTERPVTIDQGTNTLLGLDPAGIARVPALLREERGLRLPPLWDGNSGERAAAEIAKLLKLKPKTVFRGEDQ